MTLEQKVMELEEKLQKIGDIITGSEHSGGYNLNALGDKTIDRINATVRIKDAILVFPTLTKADQDDKTSRNIDLINTQTMVAVPDTPEIIDVFREAFKDAWNYAIQTGKLPENFAMDEQQNPFVDIPALLKTVKNSEPLAKALEGRRLLKNCRFNLDGDSASILLGPDGKPYGNNPTYNLSKAEVVINFAGYNKAGKKGIGRYIQGIRILEIASGGASALFF